MKGHARFHLLTCILLLALAPIAALAQKADLPMKLIQEIQEGRVRVVDLTHPLDEHSPYWPEDHSPSPFHAKVVDTFARDGYFARALEIPEHFGTHMDAPAHFDPNGRTVDQIPVESLLRPIVMIDVSAKVEKNQDYSVSLADLEAWVNAHGPIPRGCAVLIRTGWGERWPSQQKYINEDAQGVMHFPGISLEAARYLVERAAPAAIGIDTPSIDYGPSKKFEVHQFTMSHGLYHLENLIHLGVLPATGAVLIALPLDLRGGSGSPARALALLPAH